MSKNKNTEKTTKLAVNTFLRHLSILEKVKNKNVESLKDLCELKTVEQSVILVDFFFEHKTKNGRSYQNQYMQLMMNQVANQEKLLNLFAHSMTQRQNINYSIQQTQINNASPHNFPQHPVL